MNTRKFSRVPFRVDATVRTAEREFHGTVGNLSMNGMLLYTGEHLQEGELVEITITLSGITPELLVDFTARVSRTSDEGVALTLDKIDLDSYTHLKNIVAYNSKNVETVLEEIYHSIDEKLAGER